MSTGGSSFFFCFPEVVPCPPEILRERAKCLVKVVTAGVRKLRISDFLERRSSVSVMPLSLKESLPVRPLSLHASTPPKVRVHLERGPRKKENTT